MFDADQVTGEPLAAKHYLAEVFDPTLLLSFASALLGIAAAMRYSRIDVSVAILVIIGAVCVQISVNLIDDYTDVKSGIDAETTKTKFNGGNELVVNGAVKLGSVLLIGLFAIAVSAAIGTYLLASNAQAIPLILPLMLFGGLSALFYSRYLVRVPFLAEPLVMLNFALVSFGAFFLLNGASHAGSAFFAFAPAGMTVGIALLVNEVPDRPADSKYGRKSGVVLLRSEKRIAAYYLSLQAVVYALLLFGIFARALPLYTIAALATFPFAIFIAKGMLEYTGARAYESRMAANVLASFLFMMLLIAGYLL